MIENKIKSINWDWLSTLESGAKEIPEIIQHLLDPANDPVIERIPWIIANTIPPEARNRPEYQQPTFWTMQVLSDYTVHQYPVLPHTPYVVPLIIDLLDYSVVPSIGILGLLEAMLYEVPMASDPATEKYRTATKLTREEIAKGITKYLTLLRNGDQFVKRAALRLLSKFNEYADEIVPVLHYRLKSESDPKLIEDFRGAIKSLEEHHQDNQ